MSDPGAGSARFDLANLDARIRVLVAQVDQARHAYEMARTQLAVTREERTRLAERLAVTAPPPGPAPTRPVAEKTGPEASTRTVQNVLFILGGLLLGTAAIVFTAVAWASYGVGGRAAILAGLTALALAAPLVALRRSLTATAETFAAVGLLLVLLDGYAAWYVNLFGVAGGSGSRYAGLVALVTAAVSAGYGAITRLVGPGVVAALAIQPVVPLLAVPLRPGAAGWSFVAAGVAAVNLVVIAVRTGVGGDPVGRVGAATRAIGWTGFALSLAAAAGAGALAEAWAGTAAQAALAGLAVVAVAATAAAGAQLSRRDALICLAGAGCVLAPTVAGGVYVAVVWPALRLVGVAAVVCAVAMLAWAAGRTFAATSPTRRGTWAGTLVAVVGLGLALTRSVLFAAADPVLRALPPWHGALVTAPRFDWQLPAAVGLAAIAGVTALGRPYRTAVAAVAALMAVLALPGSVELAWWAPSVVDFGAAAVLVIVAVLPRRDRPARELAGVAGALLALHGLLVSLTRPESTAAFLAGLVVLGAGAGALSRVAGADRRAAGWSVAVAMSAAPPGVAAALVAADRAGALDLPPWWLARLTVAAVTLVLLALVAVRRWMPALIRYGYAAMLASAALWPAVVVARTPGEPVSVYGGVSLLLVAAALLPIKSIVEPSRAGLVAAAGGAAVFGAGMLAAGVLPVLGAVLGGPYGWLDATWSGAPAGLGLAPTAPAGLDGAASAAWALGLLALASATATYAVTARIPAALGGLWLGAPTAVILAGVAANLPWPGVPATTLLVGLAVLSAAAIASTGPVRTAAATGQGLLYIGAGLSGALAAKWSTLAGLASIVVTAAVVGAVGRTLRWRVAGCIGAVAAALALATAAGRAADLAVRDTAPGVLAVAIAALALGAAAHRRAVESRAVAAASHAGAVVALVLTAGWPGYTASLSAIWGVAVGLRALWPGTSRSGRAALAATGAAWELIAWWLLLAERGVSAIEAYTAPLAAVGLLAGWAALRARPGLRSWVSYGPSLAAAFLPSLALVLSGGATPWRRLLLGTAALVIVLAGAVRRRQAPVVTGGSVLLVLALHEIARVWDRWPRWIPLALGGLLLVGLAITYERRRRDLVRLRAAVGRMT